jgi:hypothetical protein
MDLNIWHNQKSACIPVLHCEIDGKFYKVLYMSPSKNDVERFCLEVKDFSFVVEDEDNGIFMVCELEGKEVSDV